jgi:hypothetical protein
MPAFGSLDVTHLAHNITIYRKMVWSGWCIDGGGHMAPCFGSWWHDMAFEVLKFYLTPSTFPSWSSTSP